MGINVKKRKICVNLWNLCALIRTRIRAIRAECGEETHSASPSTHRSPFNPGYPWSANLFFVILVNSFYSCENGRVSRFNSGDLAGKCADFNSQQKIALRAENNCLSISLSTDCSDLTDYLVRPSISLKGWKDYRRGWSDRREQAPVIPGPNNRSAEGTKDSCRPYRASFWGYSYTGG